MQSIIYGQQSLFLIILTLPMFALYYKILIEPSFLIVVCILSKLLERIISDQLTQYLHIHKLLTTNQSGFRKKHNPITAVLKVIYDLAGSLDGKQHCAKTTHNNVFLLIYLKGSTLWTMTYC